MVDVRMGLIMLVNSSQSRIELGDTKQYENIIAICQ
jgi:hypothetical protein